MFSQLFNLYLEEISLLKCSFCQKIEKSEPTSLGDVVSKSNYVLFYVVRSSAPQNVNFVRALRDFQVLKNQEGKIKSPASSQVLKRLFTLNRRKKRKNVIVENEISVVVIDVDTKSNDKNLNFIFENQFYFFPAQNYNLKDTLLRAIRFEFSCAPSLIVLKSENLSIQTCHGYQNLLKDKNALAFPWKDSEPSQLFTGKFLKIESDSERVVKQQSFEKLHSTHLVLGLFFGAKWYPQSRTLSQQLITFYKKLKLKFDNEFEIIYCSSDISEESFNEYFSTMPWLSFPFQDARIAQIIQTYNVSGVPSFLLIDQNNKLISRFGKNVLYSDPDGNDFPWNKKLMYELTEHSIYEMLQHTSLILFTEGTSEDTEFSMNILKPTADLLHSELKTFIANDQPCNSKTNEGNIEEKLYGTPDSVSYSSIASLNSEKRSIVPIVDPIRVFYTGEDPICDYLLDYLGLGNTELPLVMIINMLAGHMTICDKPDVSETVISDFIAEYRAGRAKIEAIPSKNFNDQKQRNFPMNIIGQHLDIH